MKKIIVFLGVMVHCFSATLQVNALNPQPIDIALEAGEYTVSSSGSWSPWRSDNDPGCRNTGCWTQSISVIIQDVTTIWFHDNNTTKEVCIPKSTIASSRVNDCSYCYGDNRGSMTIEFIKTGDVPYEPFRPLNEYETVIEEWRLPDNKTQVCMEQNGTVEVSQVNCQTTYRCVVGTCDQNDTDYPPLASNERVLFEWTDNDADRSAECSDIQGKVQDRRISCQMQHRCVKKTEACPIVPIEPISSYVSPRNESFHEDIALPGVDFTLHYASYERNNTIAQGWMPSSYAYLKDDTLHLGSGTLYAITQSSTEGNLTVIPYGSSAYLFDADGKLQSIRDLYTEEIKSTFGYDNIGRLVTFTDMYGEISTIERDGNGTATAIVAPTGQRTLLSIDGNGDLVEVQYEDTSAYGFEYENHLMTVETEPNGNRFEHFYDPNGKAIEVIDAEQGRWRFSDTTDSLQTVRSVMRPEGDTVTYTHHLLESNATTLTSQAHLPSGDTITYVRALDDGNATVKSCGMQTVTRYKKNADGTLSRDPLSGKRVLASKEVSTPGGLSNLTTYDTRYDFDANGNLVAIDHTVDRNGAIYRSKRDYRAHTLTNTSPENRVVSVRYDDRDQLPIEVRYADLAPITYRYDDKGRVIEQKQGRRVFLYRYDACGNRIEVYDKQKDAKTRYAYDLLGRVTEITYPDGSKERFGYDANGNLLARTVPTPATHTFDYNGVNKRTAQTSPEQKTTTYAYDKQRRVVKITKPGGKTIDYAYTDGRLASVTTPEGTTRYRYACRNNISKITRDGESISYGYDGTLLTSIAQSGVLNQTVSYTYNTDFLPVTVTYAGATQPYAYDKDGLLIRSGAFTLTRDAQNGYVTRLTDGTLMQSRS